MTDGAGPPSPQGAPDALRWAAALREVRGSLCEQLATGTATLEEVLDARSDPRVGDVHLQVLVESLPGTSKVATRRRLSELGVGGRRRIAGLRDGEVASVLGAFGGAPGADRGEVGER